MKGLVERCMDEYDQNGWLAPDLINPSDITSRGRRILRGDRVRVPGPAIGDELGHLCIDEAPLTGL